MVAGLSLGERIARLHALESRARAAAIAVRYRGRRKVRMHRTEGRSDPHGGTSTTVMAGPGTLSNIRPLIATVSHAL